MTHWVPCACVVVPMASLPATGREGERDAGLPSWTPFTAESRHFLQLDDLIEHLDGWHDTECNFFDMVPVFGKPGWFASGHFPPFVPVFGL